MDDFGTGHSSLIRLARFPICELKIDRTFVGEMHTQQPIVATTLQLAQTLGLAWWPRGSRTRTRSALRELGCDLAQGYFLSRPLPAMDFIAWLSVLRADLQTPNSADTAAAIGGSSPRACAPPSGAHD